jgi:hypothetical protein
LSPPDFGVLYPFRMYIHNIIAQYESASGNVET